VICISFFQHLENLRHIFLLDKKNKFGVGQKLKSGFSGKKLLNVVNKALLYFQRGFENVGHSPQISKEF
jgi:hypothetical protein